MRHCDSQQLTRNVFVLDGQVTFVTDRDKMKAIRDHGQKVARFLPDSAGRLVVAYIAWLLPAEQMLLRRCSLPEPDAGEMEFMWRHRASRAWDTDRLSNILGRLTQEHVKMRMGVARYRVVAIELGRRVRGLVMKQVESQAGEAEDGDELEIDDITGEVIHYQGGYNIVWDLQGTHGTKIARQGYAVHIGVPGRLQPELMATFRSISRLWHQFLREGGLQTRGVRRRAGDEDESGRECKRRREDEGDTDCEDVEKRIVHGLRRLMGPTSTWKSTKQMECMRMIASLRGDRCGICVLPTGAGKSLLFMIPAVMDEGGTSVVIVPYTALRLDLYEKAREKGVDVIMLEPAAVAEQERTPRTARMVIVSADSCDVESVRSYLDMLQEKELLGRIFIDEAHVAITETTFRQKLVYLNTAARYRRPVVLLTATLPVRFEKWFRRALLAEDAVTIRDQASKLNCRYEVEVVKLGTGAIDDRVMQLVSENSATMVSGERGVVYCRSIDQCKALAEAIGCPAHHSAMTAEEQESARVAWASGKGHRWIVATTGLGTGIDIGGIVSVIHAGLPYGIVDFIQQTGRGARRNGETVRSTIVYDGQWKAERLGATEVEVMNQQEMRNFVETPGCRRYILSSVMDGAQGIECSGLEGALRCDRCQPRESRATVEGRWRAHVGEEGRKTNILWDWLDDVEVGCVLCHFKGSMGRQSSKRIRQHAREPGSSCEPEMGEGYQETRRKIRFAENSCCFQCKLPLDWCGEARAREGLEEGCVYMDKVLPVVLLGYENDDIRRWVQSRFSIDMSDKAGFFRWLARRTRFHDTNGANIHILWEAMVEKMQRQRRKRERNG